MALESRGLCRFAGGGHERGGLLPEQIEERELACRADVAHGAAGFARHKPARAGQRYYEDALDGDPVGYYARNSVLTGEGRLAGSTLLPVRLGNTLGISARMASGLVVDNLRIPSDQIRRWKVEVNSRDRLPSRPSS